MPDLGERFSSVNKEDLDCRTNAYTLPRMLFGTHLVYGLKVEKIFTLQRILLGSSETSWGAQNE